MKRAEQGVEASSAGSHDEWRFRLQLLEIRMSLGRAREVEAEARRPVPQSAVPWQPLEARRWMILGLSLSERDRYPESLEALQRAEALAAGHEALLAQIEIVRASVLGRSSPGSEEEAASSQAALRHARAAGDTFHEASALGTIGYLLLVKGRYEEAIYWFEQVLPLAGKHKSRSLLAITLDNLGWCWFRLGEVERAQRRFDEANALYLEMGKRQNLHVNLGDQGSAWMGRGEYRRAIPLFEQAQKIAHELEVEAAEADWLLNLAAAHLELGDLAQAKSLLARVERLKIENSERQTPAWLLFYQGRIAEREGDRERARAAYSAVFSKVSGEPTVLFEARSRLAKMAAAAGEMEDAHRQYKALLATLETRRYDLASPEARISWLASLMRFYKDYVRFLWDQGRAEEALAVAESSRGRVLAERAPGSSQTTPASVAGLPARARRSGCTLASYWLGEEESYVWFYPPSGPPAHHRLPPRREIAGDVEAVRRQVESMRDPSLYPALERLSAALVRPGMIGDHGCLIVSPDEELYRLNFELLSWNGRSLLEQAEVRVTPSLTAAAADAGAGQGLLLFGDPETPPQADLPPLANAGAEIQAIARLFPDSTLVRGASATPGAFLRAPLEKYGLIHVAAHATAQRDAPLDSAIILSALDGKYQVTAREVSRLRLRAELVSLSACHSAGVRSYAGEGTVGLAWGFLHAGARNVIAGLWAVDDRSASRLLQQTYAGLRAGMPPAKALRAAKLSFIAEPGPLRKPFYWAPYQLYSLQ